jgi:hypothetical protein
MTNTELADQVLNGLIEIFKTGDIAQTIAKIPMIKDPNDDRPCWNWTLRNRILMVSQGTLDARNKEEWQKVGRNPINHTKTVRILKPFMSYVCNVDDGFLYYDKSKKAYVCKTCNQQIKGIPLALKEDRIRQFVKGYGVQPEYALENTYGQKLKEYTPEKKPELFELAKALNIQVVYQVDPSGTSLGMTNAQEDGQQVIHLGTEDESVYYHELAHQVDKITQGKNLKGGQDPEQEIVAQLTACVLSKMYGHNVEKLSYDYIERYAEKQNLTVEKAIGRILNRVDKILKYIFEQAEKIDQKGFIQVTA